ncbi:10417_t:CDS:2 [Funneliformis geosporum]|uniref:10417_t:CDS:1 n=1 Tax=Funneliformis geosporum TaxID=1117311 RepID=A0A9W4SPK3_9GLOM|nr:10417_t:CDS:2 [Funneliformis geosporum]
MHKESDEESDSNDKDNLELDNPEQLTSYHHQTRSKTAAATIQPA